MQEKYNNVLEKRKSMNNSVAEGRKYVAAYVEYVHYVEAISGLIAAESGHQHETEGVTDPHGKISSCQGHDE